LRLCEKEVFTTDILLSINAATFAEILNQIKMDKTLLTAPCGLDCFNCGAYEGNITEDYKKQFSEFLKIPVEETPCKGCRDEKGKCKWANGQCAE